MPNNVFMEKPSSEKHQAVAAPLGDWLSNCSSYVEDTASSNKIHADQSVNRSEEKQREEELQEFLSDESSSSGAAILPDIRQGKYVAEVSSSDSDNQYKEPASQKQPSKSSKHKNDKKKKKHKHDDSDHRKSKKKKRHHGKSEDDSDVESSKTQRKTGRLHSSNSEDSDGHKSHKKKKKKKKHKHKEHPTFRGRYAKDRYPDLPPVVPGRVFLEDIQNLSSNRPYRTDRQGDSGNFGGLYSQHLARRKCLDSLCLGHHGEQQIFLSDKKVTNKLSRYYSHTFLSHTKQKAEQIRACLKQERQSVDFIHLGDPEEGSSVSSKEVNPLGIYDKVTELYLQGKGKPEGASENLLSEEQNPLNSEETMQMAVYNSRLNESPHDIDLWLDFVKFQEKSVLVGKLRTGSVMGSDFSDKAHRKSVLEIKMAVMQKAIDKNPSSLKLKLAQLELGEDLWDSDELLKEWNSLLFHHPNNGPLWLKYLQFRESFSRRFTVSGVLKAYQKAVKTLAQVVNGEMKSHPPDETTGLYLLAVLGRACRMLLQAGHYEKTVAMYQGLLEYNLFMPQVLVSASQEDRKEFFDAFWEVSTPRVGETGAPGWGVWIENKGQLGRGKTCTQIEDEAIIEEDIVKQTASIWDTWVAMETSRSQRHWLPWRPDPEDPDKEESCEDPDRQVLCDDVTSCLVAFKSEREKFELVCQFLELLGVNSVRSSSSLLRHGSNVKFSTDVFPESILNVSQLFKQTENSFVVESSCIEEFVCNVFEQILPKFSTDYRKLLYRMIIQYRVGLCKKKGSSLKEVKSLKKWVKSLLKDEENRTSVALWEEYGRFESEFSSRDDVYKVLTVTLASQQNSMLTSASIAEKTMLCRVYRACAELQLGITCLWTEHFESPSNTCNKESVLGILHSLATGEKLGAAKTLSVSKSLKTKRAFEEFLEKLLTEGITGHEINGDDVLRMEYYGSLLVHWCSCNAYFLYLTEGLQAAQMVFEKVLSSLKQHLTKLPDLESLYDSGVRYLSLQYSEMYRSLVSLCKYHTDCSPAPLRTLREPLVRALDALPSSPTLLSLYVKLESHASISGRVRQYFRTVAPIEDSVVVWLFAILAEFTRKKKLEEYEVQHEIYTSVTSVRETGVTHQLRAWFERAVSHPAARQCVLLWRLYANFEIQQGHLDHAKAVFYRALQQCPGEKALYMDIVRRFPSQLAELTDLMIERELRVRTPVEEVEILREGEEVDGQEVDGQEVDGQEVIKQEVATVEVDRIQEMDGQEVDRIQEVIKQEVATEETGGGHRGRENTP